MKEREQITEDSIWNGGDNETIAIKSLTKRTKMSNTIPLSSTRMACLASMQCHCDCSHV